MQSVLARRLLSIIRTEGDWETWVALFLEGVATAASDAERSIIATASLIAADRRRLLKTLKARPTSYRLFELPKPSLTKASRIACLGSFCGSGPMRAVSPAPSSACGTRQR